MMKLAFYGWLLLLLALATASTLAQQSQKPANLDFKQGTPGELPTGWLFPQDCKEGGYDAKLVETDGKRCLMLYTTAMVLGEGEGKSENKKDPPRALTERGLQNLTAFTRLLGIVRHFHPSDQAADTDWEAFAVQGVKTVEDAPDAPELAKRLNALFAPIAPSARFFPTGHPPAPSAKSGATLTSPTKIVRWRNIGFGGGRIPRDRNPYSAERERADAPDGKIPDGWADPNKPFEAELGGGVSCQVPLALFEDAKGTLPRPTDTTKKASTSPSQDYSGNERTTRLADVTLAWNVFQHFYPYHTIAKTDWPKALQTALKSAATDRGERAFLDTLRSLVAALHDGHGHVNHSSDRDYILPPLLPCWVGEQLVVLQTATKGAEGLKPGDVIRKIDGQTVAEALTEKEKLISGATPQWIRYRAATDLLRGPQGSQVTLEVQRGSEPSFSVTLQRAGDAAPVEKRPEVISEIKPGIWYVDLDTQRIKMAEFQQALPKLEQAKGIVFDMRGYPNEVALQVLPRLGEKPITSAGFLIPTFYLPDQKDVTFRNGAWPPTGPYNPRFKGKIAFLTDGRAISYAESVMGIVEHYKLGEIVGGPTAGTNGNVNPFSLPGGYMLSWTGMKVVKHDGSQHHGVGIQPTVPVSRTLAGIAAGRDEVLEKGIEIVTPRD